VPADPTAARRRKQSRGRMIKIMLYVLTAILVVALAYARYSQHLTR
jgi:hypothetical protein